MVTYKEVTAPVKIGDEVGSISYSYNGAEIGSIPILARQDVEEARNMNVILLSIVIVIVICLVGGVSICFKKRKKD